MLFFYIRHGEPIYDPDSLTTLGHAQANALAGRLSLHGLDQIYSSSSTRAMQTAQPTCDILKKEMTICDWANERYAWDVFTIKKEDGKSEWCFMDDEMCQLFLSPEVRSMGMDWYKHPSFTQYDFAKGMKHANEAVDNFFSELGYQHDRENARYKIVKANSNRVALFAHAGFGMCFLSSLLDIPYPMFCTHFDLGHSSMTVINFKEQGDYAYPRVLQYSNDSHLYRENILTGYNNEIHF
ncbi:MAG: histidine phosphatase family protein [Tyzzerella sp.]|nr:histidine phosphatase family protein [Tyzzerella sp.]